MCEICRTLTSHWIELSRTLQMSLLSLIMPRLGAPSGLTRVRTLTHFGDLNTAHHSYVSARIRTSKSGQNRCKEACKKRTRLQDLSKLLQILLLRQIIDQIKHHPSSKPASLMRTGNAACVRRLFVRDLVSLTTAPACCSVRKQLDVADFVEEVKPVDRLFDGLSDSKEAVIP